MYGVSWMIRLIRVIEILNMFLMVWCNGVIFLLLVSIMLMLNISVKNISDRIVLLFDVVCSILFGMIDSSMFMFFGVLWMLVMIFLLCLVFFDSIIVVICGFMLVFGLSRLISIRLMFMVMLDSSMV